MRKITLIKEKDPTNIFDVSNVTVMITEGNGHLPTVLVGIVDFLLAIGYGQETIDKYLNTDALDSEIAKHHKGEI